MRYSLEVFIKRLCLEDTDFVHNTINQWRPNELNPLKFEWNL